MILLHGISYAVLMSLSAKREAQVCSVTKGAYGSSVCPSISLA